MNFFMPPWWKLAAAGMILVALAGGAWKLRHGGLVAGRAEIQAEWTAAALVASEKARAKEQVLTTANAKVTNDYIAQKKLRAADAVAADGKLRELQAALHSGSTDTAADGGTDDPRDSIIDQCASALVALDRYAQSVASTASGLQGYTAEVCLK